MSAPQEAPVFDAFDLSSLRGIQPDEHGLNLTQGQVDAIVGGLILPVDQRLEAVGLSNVEGVDAAGAMVETEHVLTDPDYLGLFRALMRRDIHPDLQTLDFYLGGPDTAKLDPKDLQRARCAEAIVDSLCFCSFSLILMVNNGGDVGRTLYDRRMDLTMRGGGISPIEKSKQNDAIQTRPLFDENGKMLVGNGWAKRTHRANRSSVNEMNLNKTFPGLRALAGEFFTNSTLAMRRMHGQPPQGEYVIPTPKQRPPKLAVARPAVTPGSTPKDTSEITRLAEACPFTSATTGELKANPLGRMLKHGAEIVLGANKRHQIEGFGDGAGVALGILNHLHQLSSLGEEAVASGIQEITVWLQQAEDKIQRAPELRNGHPLIASCVASIRQLANPTTILVMKGHQVPESPYTQAVAPLLARLSKVLSAE